MESKTKKVLTVLAIAAAGGLAYWWYKTSKEKAAAQAQAAFQQGSVSQWNLQCTSNAQREYAQAIASGASVPQAMQKMMMAQAACMRKA